MHVFYVLPPVAVIKGLTKLQPCHIDLRKCEDTTSGTLTGWMLKIIVSCTLDLYMMKNMVARRNITEPVMVSHFCVRMFMSVCFLLIKVIFILCLSLVRIWQHAWWFPPAVSVALCSCLRLQWNTPVPHQYTCVLMSACMKRPRADLFCNASHMY